MTSRLLVLLLGGFVALASPAAAPKDDELDYRGEFFPGSEYDPSVPTPESILGFPVGERTATPEQIGECLEAWARASSRMRVREYARTHEGRPLWYVILTSRENISRLDEIHAGVEKLADPRGLSGNEADRLVASLPAVAWMAYSIHGDETSGADAALAVIYHLAAARDEAVEALLDDLVVLIDPMMNPDGRGRFVQQIAEHRGAQPNIDDQSLLHTGYWPWGRMNHYLFDLNRDWILGVHPETRGRIRAAGGWHPLFFVDAHEMGAQDTYLFSPPRDPLNPNFPGWQAEWLETFAREQGAAFDRAGWTYYSGEWNEGWYPGYSDAWAGFRGAIGFLYEQAGIAEDAVRRPEGTLLTYREAVHHQVATTLANLNSLRDHAGAIWEAYLSGRRQAVAADGPYANRTFAVLPTANRSRLQAFLDLMTLQGFELFTAGADFTVSEATDQLGIVHRR
ncbi:MAG: M14 family zinc carboxypeptidase, partial [Acidobacteriota bacterium]